MWFFKPKESVSTALVFGSPHLTRDTETVKMSDFSGRRWFLGNSPFGANDLEPVVLQAFPSIALTREWLIDQGYDVRLTGSGACFLVSLAVLSKHCWLMRGCKLD